MLKRLTALIAALLCSLAVAAGVAAAAADEPIGFTIFPHSGVSEGSDIDGGHPAGLGVGYRFEGPWSVELVFQALNAERRGDAYGRPEGVDVDTWRVDGIYHGRPYRSVFPYLAIGLGKSSYDYRGLPPYTDPASGAEIESSYKAARTEREDHLNAGFGLTWPVNERTSLRADLRLYHGTDDNELSSTLGLGVQHVFGTASWQRPAFEDADNDGVNDSADRCPGTPFGSRVDRTGCSIDNDGDGVPNYRDRCPDTPLGERVDRRGCLPILYAGKAPCAATLDLKFDFDSSAFKTAHEPQLRQLAAFLKRYRDVTVALEGHADSLGSVAYNQRLSEERAKQVADILVTRFGIAAHRVSSRGYGESRPVASNSTAQGRAQNRRVTLSASSERAAQQAICPAPGAAEMPDMPKLPEREAGCPVELDLRFDFDSFDTREGYRAQLRRLADFMREHRAVTVVLEGHTDSRGDAGHNQRLSERRAGYMADILVREFGIAASRVSARGFGETRPVAPSGTERGRAQNRRVTLNAQGVPSGAMMECPPSAEARPAEVKPAKPVRVKPAKPVYGDEDGDGVRDSKDRCPGTPAGARVDRHGCSIDKDGDGVADKRDRCPNTPAGTKVNRRGCPDVPVEALPDGDADGDGVADSKDRCPGTPAGAEVDRRGCPDVPDGDADGDGVRDSRDRCPGTPAGAEVDRRGCPDVPDGDADGDGVRDSRDRCPGTPAGAEVDRRGCPVTEATMDEAAVRADAAGDEDGDGVPNGEDRCLGTPSGAQVSRRGCSNDEDQDGVPNRRDRCPDTPGGAKTNRFGCVVTGAVRRAADEDGDGVANLRDRCPDTPSGVRTNRFGCPVTDTAERRVDGDADGDGVRDSRDRCPGTPAGAEVNRRGCPDVPDGDADGDGVRDSKDRCPGTPAGAEVNRRGCADTDTTERRVDGDADGDGVRDSRDRCPGTPAGAEVNRRGCPDKPDDRDQEAVIIERRSAKDTDSDGVRDSRDRCPGTPSGAQVNPAGCPPAADGDGDGVADKWDRCPNTPSGAQVNRVGCSR